VELKNPKEIFSKKRRQRRCMSEAQRLERKKIKIETI
jgi:hypothetical protein